MPRKSVVNFCIWQSRSPFTQWTQIGNHSIRWEFTAAACQLILIITKRCRYRMEKFERLFCKQFNWLISELCSTVSANWPGVRFGGCAAKCCLRCWWRTPKTIENKPIWQFRGCPACFHFSHNLSLSLSTAEKSHTTKTFDFFFVEK